MHESYDWEKGILLNRQAYPKTTPEYQPLLDCGDLSKLEDFLMERIEETPHDIAFFLPAYRFFIRKNDSNRLSALLGLHIESLKSHRELGAEISLLQEILDLWGECRYARDLLIGHLKTMYNESPNFDLYSEHFAVTNGNTTLDKLRQFEVWLRYDEGRVIYIPSKGVAQVREANPKLSVVRIITKKGEQMSFRIEEAERMSVSLPNNHFLAQTLIDSERLRQIALNDPGELLRLLFESIKKQTTLGELREMLSGIITEEQWSSWWSRARKDSRLIIGTGTKPKISWINSAAEGDSGILSSFSEAGIRDKIEMIRKYSSRSESLAAEMARILTEEASRLVKSDPSTALEIILTIKDLPKCKDTAVPFTAEQLLSGTNVKEVISAVKDRLIRKNAVRIIAGAREDWPGIYGSLLKTETDAGVISLLYESLTGAGHKDIIDSEIRRTLSDPSGNPHFFLWLCKEMQSRSELHGYADRGFLLSLFRAIDHKAFRGRLAALRELFDPGSLVDRALETLDAPACSSMLDAITRVRELEDYRKESMRRKIFILFPELDEKKQKFMLVTKESIEKKRLEYEKLVKEDIPKNSKEIQRTREYGDLRENFEYHEARRQQEILSSRAKTLHDELVSARAIEPEKVDASKISVGTRVRLLPDDGTGDPITITILGPWDSDPAKNIISYTSAAAEAILNATKGSIIQFNGAMWKVDSIERWM